jgi:hypothetical protein
MKRGVSQQSVARRGLRGTRKKGHENVPFWVLDGLSEIGKTLLE